MKSMQDLLNEARSEIAEISAETAMEMDKGLLLDVREPAELAETGRAAGAVHIPRGVLESRADPESSAADMALVRLRGKKEPVIVYCASGARGALAAKTLSDMGYTARNVAGGIAAWRKAGGQMTPL